MTDHNDDDAGVDFTAFRLWLMDVRGVSRRTSYTAVSQVRLVLRSCGPVVTTSSLADWHAEQDGHQRTPIVSNWRRYREWWESQGVSGLPDFPRRRPASGSEPVPAALGAALSLLRSAGVSMPVISSLRWDPLESGVLYDALRATTPGLASGEVQAMRTPTAGIVLIPTLPLDALISWGHNGSPLVGAPLVPREPGSSEPMTLTRLRRLARRSRKG